MDRFVIRSTAGLPLAFVVAELFGNEFLIVGEHPSEVNVEGIVSCLCQHVPSFRYGASRIMWGTQSEYSVTGSRLLRELFVPLGAEQNDFAWSAPYLWDHQHRYVRDAVERCEALLANPDAVGRLD